MTDDDIVNAVRVRQRISDHIYPEPASSAQVEQAELKIGYSLSPLLRRLYLEVSNGGFGPQRGVMAVAPGPRSAGDVISDLWYGDEPNDPLHGLCGHTGTSAVLPGG